MHFGFYFHYAILKRRVKKFQLYFRKTGLMQYWWYFLGKSVKVLSNSVSSWPRTSGRSRSGVPGPGTMATEDKMLIWSIFKFIKWLLYGVAIHLQFNKNEENEMLTRWHLDWKLFRNILFTVVRSVLDLRHGPCDVPPDGVHKWNEIEKSIHFILAGIIFWDDFLFCCEIFGGSHLMLWVFQHAA